MISPRVALAVLLSIGLLGCDGAQEDSKTLQKTDIVPNTAPPPHHPEHGPKGGHIFKLGAEGFHAEVVMDQSRKLTIYLLDETQKNPKPVGNGTLQIAMQIDGKETTLDLVPAPLDTEKDGQCSQFELSADKVPGAIMSIEQLTGNLTLKFGEKTLTTSLTDEHHHDEHDHEGHAHEEAAPEKK